MNRALKLQLIKNILLQLNSYLCPECGKSLSTNENLKRHLIRHTGIKVNLIYAPSYAIEINKIFLQPYACSLCPSRFVFKSGLTSHMSTHTGLKPFICGNILIDLLNHHRSFVFFSRYLRFFVYKIIIINKAPPNSYWRGKSSR